MLFANYHTHTPRYNHARGEEREYIEAAIQAGYQLLGFSDHSPYVFENGHDSGFRMKLEETENYVSTLQALRREYEKDITLLIGFEAEYYPRLFAKTLAFLHPFDYDFLLLGQHFTVNETDGVSVNLPMTDGDLHQFVDQTCQAMHTGAFTYFNHPDMPLHTGSPAAYEREMTRLCQTALETDTPLELNLLGIRGKRNYPHEPFWEIVQQIGNPVIIGVDAHDPRNLDHREALDEALKLVEKYRLRLIDRVPIKDPHTCALAKELNLC